MKVNRRRDVAPLYQRLASLVQAIVNCRERGNDEWLEKHTEKLLKLVKQHLPSGSGFDNGTKIDLQRSHGNRLHFCTAFHHMDEGGGYDGWTDHDVVVKSHLSHGIEVLVFGPKRNDIRDYIAEAFAMVMWLPVDREGVVVELPEACEQVKV